MNILDYPGASHFCRQFDKTLGNPSSSVRQFLTSYPTLTRLPETDPMFEVYRSHLFRDVDRCLFFAASNYRRSLDLMFASSAPWAQVTLYYSSYFASMALLGMFGGYVNASRKIVIEVLNGNPGTQEIVIRRNFSNWKASGGTHAKYWSVYYQACTHFSHWLPAIPSYHFAVNPVSSDPFWQTNQRNDVNYDLDTAANCVVAFPKSLRSSNFPACLTGALSTQHKVTNDMIGLAFYFAKKLNLKSDALKIFGVSRSRKKTLHQLVFAPQLTRLRRHENRNVILV